MCKKIEGLHHHELVSFEVHPQAVILNFGPLVVTVREIEIHPPVALSALVGKSMTRWIMDEDSFRLAFEDWTLLVQDFAPVDSLVEVRGPEPDRVTLYPQAFFDENPAAKQAIDEMKRRQSAFDDYVVSEKPDLSAQSAKLLRTLHQRFSKPPNHDLADFMLEYGSVQGALLYARLFVPEFRVIAGRVVLESHAKAYAKAVAESPTEDVDPDSFNWEEVFYLFERSDTGFNQYQYEDDLVLAELIVEAWRGRLLYLFPERTFVVEILPDEETVAPLAWVSGR